MPLPVSPRRGRDLSGAGALPDTEESLFGERCLRGAEQQGPQFGRKVSLDEIGALLQQGAITGFKHVEIGCFAADESPVEVPGTAHDASRSAAVNPFA